LFILGILPIAYSNKIALKVMLFVPLLILWSWSCANQLFNPAYETDDYRDAAKIIKNDKHSTSQIVALCNPKALTYYEVNKPIIYLPETSKVTCDTLSNYLTEAAKPTWVALSRPWNYPAFRPEKLKDYYQILCEKHLPGIDMWLLTLPNSQ
jgi:hypothetical protein